MKLLSESQLRAEKIPDGTLFYEVGADVFVTPMAKEYLKERGIALKISETKTQGTLMAKENIKTVNNKKQFVDYESGKVYDTKPENMTHLYSNVLVPKNHPRIILRGSLDKLQALIIRTQSMAEKEHNSYVSSALDEILSFVREILGCEVTGRKLSSFRLLGYGADELRDITHDLPKHFGMEHTLPDYKNGLLLAELNLIRTAVRETELHAVEAFSRDGEVERVDIIEALNRLSSTVYIVYCKVLSGK